MTRTWSIGELADEFDTTLRTIRHYEELGLLAPTRNGQQRVYTERDRVRLRLILRGKRLGFTLDEVAHIINLYDDPPGESGQLEFLLGEIDRRRSDLLQRRADLDAVLDELDDLDRRCRADLAALGGRTS
ncbi:MerR family transcriptional regulator [Microlunatus ginsengisoli]|uniref:MerR family DNA-binding transcriptional regulator n=1 Tax=Microlunatus ginsengisoli TaxID=363863 RepID=A0ABP7A9G4_9ACTN